MKKFIPLSVVLILLVSSCVSKKKYLTLEEQYNDTKGNLQKTTLEKKTLEAKFAKIEERVVTYNEKINSLNEFNDSLKQENDVKLDLVGNTAVISNSMKLKMRSTLQKVDQTELANATTLTDSMNLAMAYNLNKSIGASDLADSTDIDVSIDKTVVMISVADNLLFNTANYRVKNEAHSVLSKLAEIIKSEPSMDVMIEGHTDSRTINTAVIQDNWDLSVLRATSVVRKLQKQFKVSPEQLIASGRSSYQPLVENDFQPITAISGQ